MDGVWEHYARRQSQKITYFMISFIGNISRTSKSIDTKSRWLPKVGEEGLWNNILYGVSSGDGEHLLKSDDDGYIALWIY